MNSASNVKGKQASYDLSLKKHHFVIVCVVILMLCMYLADTGLFTLTVATISDAYLAVSVFVALTLSLVYLAHQYLKADLIGYLNTHTNAQVPIATLLGILPGCGGAIIVVTQFVRGQVSFGALVAVLISTMGDASFLLLARAPVTAAMVFSTCAVAAIIFGYLINFIHGNDFLKPTPSKSIIKAHKSEPVPLPTILLDSWLWLLVPGCAIGVLLAFQINVDAFFGKWAIYEPVMWVGFVGAILSIFIWILRPLNSWSIHYVDSHNNTPEHDTKAIWESVAAETSFVSVWVITGFLCFELLLYFTGWDLGGVFRTLGPLTPLFAVLVGFIPGCGPQIIMTTLYLQGIVPLSAQIANATSNDGDALFPAIAMAPKAAIYATLYSAIPALILGYIAYSLGF
ncbi:MAG: putative manganese transporter [Arenicella sp.]